MRIVTFIYVIGRDAVSSHIVASVYHLKCLYYLRYFSMLAAWCAVVAALRDFAFKYHSSISFPKRDLSLQLLVYFFTLSCPQYDK